ncbi:MAG: GNAT family N-acetyltransferase [Rhodospirillaceae bacterium]|nr:GNAT family N-acetyltransferase [Rhodospirillaceae bacterium]
MNISYRHDAILTPEAYADVLNRTSLGARRPVGDPNAVALMLQHADILITAWDAEKLVGVARSFTDRAFVTYLADLAVDEAYQKQGIGKQLIAETAKQCLPTCRIVLFAAPDAETYYGRVGLYPMTTGWGLAAGTLPKGTA